MQSLYSKYNLAQFGLTLFHLNGVFWDPAEMILLIIFKSVWYRCQYSSYSSTTWWLFRKILLRNQVSTYVGGSLGHGAGVGVDPKVRVVPKPDNLSQI